MACLIAVPALIMPAALRRSQHVFQCGRVHTALRVSSFSTQCPCAGSYHIVAVQGSKQPDAATPHQINRLSVMATNIGHAASDLDMLDDEPFDSTASTTDLMTFWRRVADGAAALTVIMALMLAPLSGSAWAARSGGRMGGSSFSSARSSGSSSRSYGGGSSSRSSYSSGSSRSSYSSGSSSRSSFGSGLGRSSSSSGGSSSSSSSVTIAPSPSYYSSTPWAGSGSQMTSVDALAADRPMTEAEAQAVGYMALGYLFLYCLFVVWSLVSRFWRGW